MPTKCVFNLRSFRTFSFFSFFFSSPVGETAVGSSVFGETEKIDWLKLTRKRQKKLLKKNLDLGEFFNCNTFFKFFFAHAWYVFFVLLAYYAGFGFHTLSLPWHKRPRAKRVFCVHVQEKLWKRVVPQLSLYLETSFLFPQKSRQKCEKGAFLTKAISKCNAKPCCVKKQPQFP